MSNHDPYSDQQLMGRDPAIQHIASTPELIGIKLNAVPMALQKVDDRNFARYAVELAGLVALRRR